MVYLLLRRERGIGKKTVKDNERKRDRKGLREWGIQKDSLRLTEIERVKCNER